MLLLIASDVVESLQLQMEFIWTRGARLLHAVSVVWSVNWRRLWLLLSEDMLEISLDSPRVMSLLPIEYLKLAENGQFWQTEWKNKIRWLNLHKCLFENLTSLTTGAKRS